MTIRSMVTNQAYREGFERAFGRKQEPWERQAVRELGGGECEECGRMVMERRWVEKRLLCATCERG